MYKSYRVFSITLILLINYDERDTNTARVEELPLPAPLLYSKSNIPAREP